LGSVVLIPAGEQSAAGSLIAPERGRLELSRAEAPYTERVWVAAEAGELVETDACGIYLRVDQPARLETGADSGLDVLPGLYQVIRK
jgi:hypothetical protein